VKRRTPPLKDDPQWYKDAILYELRVRSFFDSNGDGIGDFAGLTQKLDYLEDLGVNTLWLLPFYPSPMRDDGYDIADYTGVHPDLGTLPDFKRFLDEAHRRGLRVVTELVINHTSDQHPWFQRARRAPTGSAERDFYVWSDTQEKYEDARIIFQDFEPSNWAWDPIAKAYYWHRFFAHQPDLNFHSPLVKKAIFEALDFWMELGVDGVRLDAVPYLFEQEGTNCENLPETHAFLRELRTHVDAKFKNRMLLAEANQWPEDAVAYLDERECHMAFHFPIMPRMYMALRMEDRFPITDIVAQTPWPEGGCQWALFLRNHDELTLEMVTDEERDYMYSAFAREHRMRVNVGIRRRFAPLMGNNRRAMELLNALLFSLPGTPVLYYGDEIGMGDNIWLGDRDAVRTPMQWNGDRNAGFSRANPQQLVAPVVIDPEYHFETVNVEAHQSNPHSLLWWMRRLIALRKRHPAFGRGDLKMLAPENPKVLAFVRTLGEERILVIANLSRFLQPVSVDLSAWKDLVPLELFGRTRFPAIGEGPWSMSLSPHAFAWFSLEAPRPAEVWGAGSSSPHAALDGAWESGMPDADARPSLEAVLPGWLAQRPAARGLVPVRAEIADLVAVHGEAVGVLAFVSVENVDGAIEPWVVPLVHLAGSAAASLKERAPEAIVGDLVVGGVIADGLADPAFCRTLLAWIASGEPLAGTAGSVVPLPQKALAAAVAEGHEPRQLRGAHQNPIVVFGDRLVLKLLARSDDGPSPEIEELEAIAPIAPAIVPSFLAAVEYRAGRNAPRPIAVIQGYVAHQSDAWTWALEEVKRFHERMLSRRELPPPQRRPLTESLLDPTPLAPAMVELVDPFLDSASLLGRRLAGLHAALASPSLPIDFAPVAYGQLYQRSVYQTMRNLSGYVLRDLAAKRATLPENAREDASAVLAKADAILERFGRFQKSRMEMKRVRVHGDLHLREVLWTGKDFVFVDFEGDRTRTVAERRRKRSALRDVASLVVSMYSASQSAVRSHARQGVPEREREAVAAWTDAWQVWVSRAIVHGYLEHAPGGVLYPSDSRALAVALDAFLLEKALSDLGAALTLRPERAWIALAGIRRILGT